MIEQRLFVVRGQRIHPEKYALARRLRAGMTPAERRLWQYLSRNGLYGRHFRRQQLIDGFIADFYCHEAGLIVEIDGSVHNSQPGYDQERTRILQARGLTVQRFTNDEVLKRVRDVLRSIDFVCQQRGSPRRGSKDDRKGARHQS
jgi:very-short-patch-repair endonuclease